MKIDQLTLGAFETNSYVLRQSDDSRDCLIIDTGLDAGNLPGFLAEHDLKPVALVFTHGHVDHIGGVAVLRSKFPDMKVYIHQLDAEMLTRPDQNLSQMTGMPFSTDPQDSCLAEGDTVEQAGVRLQVLHTPGHTPGGICLYSQEDGVAFVGDTLFADSVGRTDFPNGSMAQLIDSIKEKLFTMPDETKVYPGHGPATTIAHEKEYNPFIR